ncbi:MAG TPA: glycoside hydrolase family 2 TIM barrel-domain containing protein [bacterium]|nr:glycoside hydrolase family 2 TIM barrel-domain containing protein [bacterium]
MEKFYKRVPARVNPLLRHKDEKSFDLGGQWLFTLDPQDKGIKEKWYVNKEVFSAKISVPGSWQGQGCGDESLDKIWDFRLKARVYRATYHGTGWYGKIFRIPQGWENKKIWIYFGGVHPSCEIWVNGKYIGSHSGPFVPFAFDITDVVERENDNFIAVRVSEKNRWLGLAFNWAGYWSGLYRTVELVGTGDAWVEHCWIHSDPVGKCMDFMIKTGGNQEDVDLEVFVKDPSGKQCGQITRTSGHGKIVFSIPVKEGRLWTPETPFLYQVDVELKRNEEIVDCICERVGFLHLSTKDKHFLINNQPYYMMGTGDFSVNPETGCPDTDRQRWRKKLSVLRQYGYIYIRCQSYVPVPEYLDVADEVGLLVQSEIGMMGAWGGHSQYHQYQWPQPDAERRELLRYQWNAAVIRDVNHVSANLYCMSNEYGHPVILYPETAWKCYRETKAIKPSSFVIWTDGTVRKIKGMPLDFYCAEAKEDNRVSMPVIQHEFRWWTSFPDISNKGKFTGAVRPYAIEIALENAKKAQLDHLLPELITNSQKLQFIEAKTKLEQIRRDYPNLAGICHFTAMDIGFSPQGVIDEFYEKKFVTAEVWRQTTGPTAILTDSNFDDRIYVSGMDFEKTIFISDFSHPPLKNPAIEWDFSGETVKEHGEFSFTHKPFCTDKIGNIRIRLPDVQSPEKVRLRIKAKEEGRTFENHWDYWIFPETTNMVEFVVYGKAKKTWIKTLKAQNIKKSYIRGVFPKLVVSEIFDRNLANYVADGGKLILAVPEGFTRPFFPKLGLVAGRYFFTPPANYPTYEDGNTGTIVRNHPMLGDFPHENFCDLQFYRMIAEFPPIDLRPFGDLKEEPVIRSFSTCFRMYPLAYLIEFSWGKGHIIITSLNFDQNLPEARYLFTQMLKYLENAKLPENKLNDVVVDRLIEESSEKIDIFGSLKLKE